MTTIWVASEPYMRRRCLGHDPQVSGLQSGVCSIPPRPVRTRYPHSNDSKHRRSPVTSAATSFNSPFPYKEDDYVQRVDFNLNNKMKLWGKGNFVRTNGTQSPIQFPGDPATFPFLDRAIPGWWGTFGRLAIPWSTRRLTGRCTKTSTSRTPTTRLAPRNTPALAGPAREGRS